MSDTLNAGDRLGTGQSLTSANGAYTLTLQDDGNLVLNDGGTAVWSTKTNGKGVVRATVQEDGNFVLYNGSDEGVWSTKTSGAGARLVLQDDRNVVLYVGDNGEWSSKTVTDNPVAAPVSNEPAPAPKKTYTVVAGDTLFAIAERFLGDGNRYPELAKANGIANPDLINVGQVITIP
ncbi:putative mannose-binding protein [Gordonia araii NBRC 100433]|uniref:Putative mannose-binding protein n=1 Tax=Gordonia araii NBRC 100433 TaxID=1073574 RepID=G7H2V2_9ACTN|nr:LysM peptidoglycan-binding domain-containing protein [Gordonia araii]NNG98338.1 LysM peptidoglycan-binding domain-containing protein [Gordonia araii NBRC 100433]GAB10177.1 putative mannose-binding protein [Gordonia araii NBRC 100433]